MRFPAVLAPLRYGSFARYMAGEAVSMLGTWMQIFAQGWVLTSLTPSAIALGAVNFAAGVPMLCLTLVGGLAADRYDKRVILHLALATQVISSAAIGWLVATEQIAIWHIFVAAVVHGIAAAFEVPTVSAFVPELVPKEQMSRAIAIDRSIFHATRLIGPAVGGYLVGAVGVAYAYYVNAVSFFALIAALLTIAPRQRGTTEEEEKRKGRMSEGFAFVRADVPTRIMVLLMAAITFFASPFLTIMMPLYARSTLGLGPDKMGLLMGVSGIGSFVGSLGLLSIPSSARGLALRIGGVAAVLAISGMAFAKSFVIAGTALVLLTLGLSTAFGLANIIIQERAPDHIRGRVSAVAGLSFFGILPFSGLLISGAVEALGMRTTLWMSAAAYAICLVLLLGPPRALSTSTVGEPAMP